MHTIEPYYKWRDLYIAANDQDSPYFNHVNSEFHFTDKVYNYYIHPQWDGFGSETLYLKILFVDYDQQFAIIELIGEWNDCIGSDIIALKRNIIDLLLEKGIHQYILLCDNVLNFHADDDCYYQEWYEEVSEFGGWITILNLREHIIEEMATAGLHYYMHFQPPFSELNWRLLSPPHLFKLIDTGVTKLLC